MNVDLGFQINLLEAIDLSVLARVVMTVRTSSTFLDPVHTTLPEVNMREAALGAFIM